MKTVKMGEMTVGELQQYLKTSRTIILPYGVVEQHGHHLPLDTDIRNAEIMGAKLAEKLGCIVAPTLNYCFSGGMLTGTINVKPNTFSNMMGEIVESLVLQGFQNIIILPGHGGSESLQHLKESLRILKWLNPALKDTLVMLVQLWNFSPTWLNLFKTRDYHAGEAETSLIKYWTPESVRGKIVLDKPTVAEMLRNDPDSYQKRTSFTGLNEEIMFTEQRAEVKVGVMGYPERATAATGEKLNEEILKNAVPALKKAIAAAVKARKNGTAIEMKNNDKLKILSL
ncbi:MAG: creatininase family protein [Lentisphaerae bacterium]|nr:creatininase family protein [Lentisphaerota bacterium]